jgi:hypothetical protein
MAVPGSTLMSRTSTGMRCAERNYLMLYKPEYFTVSAIGVERDFLVAGEGNRFTLTEDMVPLG